MEVANKRPREGWRSSSLPVEAVEREPQSASQHFGPPGQRSLSFPPIDVYPPPTNTMHKEQQLPDVNIAQDNSTAALRSFSLRRPITTNLASPGKSCETAVAALDSQPHLSATNSATTTATVHDHTLEEESPFKSLETLSCAAEAMEAALESSPTGSEWQYHVHQYEQNMANMSASWPHHTASTTINQHQHHGDAFQMGHAIHHSQRLVLQQIRGVQGEEEVSPCTSLVVPYSAVNPLVSSGRAALDLQYPGAFPQILLVVDPRPPVLLASPTLPSPRPVHIPIDSSWFVSSMSSLREETPHTPPLFGATNSEVASETTSPTSFEPLSMLGHAESSWQPFDGEEENNYDSEGLDESNVFCQSCTEGMDDDPSTLNAEKAARLSGHETLQDDPLSVHVAQNNQKLPHEHKNNRPDYPDGHEQGSSSPRKRPYSELSPALEDSSPSYDDIPFERAELPRPELLHFDEMRIGAQKMESVDETPGLPRKHPLKLPADDQTTANSPTKNLAHHDDPIHVGEVTMDEFNQQLENARPFKEDSIRKKVTEPVTASRDSLEVVACKLDDVDTWSEPSHPGLADDEKSKVNGEIGSSNMRLNTLDGPAPPFVGSRFPATGKVVHEDKRSPILASSSPIDLLKTTSLPSFNGAESILPESLNGIKANHVVTANEASSLDQSPTYITLSTGPFASAGLSKDDFPGLQPNESNALADDASLVVDSQQIGLDASRSREAQLLDASVAKPYPFKKDSKDKHNTCPPAPLLPQRGIGPPTKRVTTELVGFTKSDQSQAENSLEHKTKLSESLLNDAMASASHDDLTMMQDHLAVEQSPDVPSRFSRGGHTLASESITATSDQSYSEKSATSKLISYFCDAVNDLLTMPPPTNDHTCEVVGLVDLRVKRLNKGIEREDQLDRSFNTSKRMARISEKQGLDVGKLSRLPSAELKPITRQSVSVCIGKDSQFESNKALGDPYTIEATLSAESRNVDGLKAGSNHVPNEKGQQLTGEEAVLPDPPNGGLAHLLAIFEKYRATTDLDPHSAEIMQASNSTPSQSFYQHAFWIILLFYLWSSAMGIGLWFESQMRYELEATLLRQKLESALLTAANAQVDSFYTVSASALEAVTSCNEMSGICDNFDTPFVSEA